MKPVFVIPHEKVREDVEEIIGEEASIVFISTPGQVYLPLFVSFPSYKDIILQFIRLIISPSLNRINVCVKLWTTCQYVVLKSSFATWHHDNHESYVLWNIPTRRFLSFLFKAEV